jgi:hypothetical protein
MSLGYLVVELIKKLAPGTIIETQSIQSAIYKQYPEFFKQWNPNSEVIA